MADPVHIVRRTGKPLDTARVRRLYAQIHDLKKVGKRLGVDYRRVREVVLDLMPDDARVVIEYPDALRDKVQVPETIRWRCACGMLTIGPECRCGEIPEWAPVAIARRNAALYDYRQPGATYVR